MPVLHPSRRQFLRRTLAVAGTGLLPALAWADAGDASPPPNTLTDAERADGWRLLFDGKSFAGWRSMTSVTPPAGWRVIDGQLVRVAHSSDLVTADEFGDFELSAEWKIDAGSNSGILYRVGLGNVPPSSSGIEYQLLDPAVLRDLVAKGSHFGPKNSTAAIYDLVAPSESRERAVGEWNTARIVIQGWRTQHWLNGGKVAELDLRSAEGRALIRKSKFSGKAYLNYATRDRGHITLQDHTGGVAFRSLKIRPR